MGWGGGLACCWARCRELGGVHPIPPHPKHPAQPYPASPHLTPPHPTPTLPSPTPLYRNQTLLQPDFYPLQPGLIPLYSTPPHYTTPHPHPTPLQCSTCTALLCTALLCTALLCTALHCLLRTAPHCTALHCTALHPSPPTLHSTPRHPISTCGRVSGRRAQFVSRMLLSSGSPSSSVARCDSPGDCALPPPLSALHDSDSSHTGAARTQADSAAWEERSFRISSCRPKPICRDMGGAIQGVIT